jgi:D-alanyl-D-alanine carboxypeptidase (penicillin-binding protein 5/6)
MDFRKIFGVFGLVCLVLTGVLPGAESFIVVEAHSGRVVGRQSENKRRPVASLTKVATAMVALDWAALTKADLGQLAVVPFSATVLGGANPMGLRPGDQITLRNALYSALLGSDNVAAQTIAHHIGFAIQEVRGQPGDPVAIFVGEMNRLAAGLGMRRTKFANPHGLDTRERGMSTAEDMARLCIYATRDPGFRFYVKQTSRAIEIERAGQKIPFSVKNTNKLLGQMDINGIKTGMTQLAGQCLAVNSERPNLVLRLPDGRSQLTGRRLICVVLGSSDRFGQAGGLVEQGWMNYDRWMTAGKPISNAKKDLLLVPAPR